MALEALFRNESVNDYTTEKTEKTNKRIGWTPLRRRKEKNYANYGTEYQTTGEPTAFFFRQGIVWHFSPPTVP
jgi:hypothetical protein